MINIPNAYKRIFTIFILAISPYSLSQSQTKTIDGTIILIYGDSSQVIIAADSKEVSSDSTIILPKACKIHVLHNLIFTHAGLGGTLGKGKNGFSISEIARQSFALAPINKSIDNVWKTFRNLCTVAYDSLLRSLYREDSVSLIKNFENMVMETALIGKREQGISVFYSQYHPQLAIYRTMGNPYNDIEWNSWMGLPLWKPMGIRGYIATYVGIVNAQKFFQTYGLREGMTKFIEMDIGFFPESIDTPIQVIKFSDGKPTWLKRELPCQECEYCPDR